MHPRSLAFLLLTCFFALLSSRAQDPGQAQDAEEARQKLLRAVDQIDVISRQNDDLRQQITSVRNDLDTVRSDNTALQSQLTQLKSDNAALKAAFDKSEADRTKERQVLLAEVAKIVAGGKKKIPPPTGDAPPDAPAATPATSADAPPAPSATDPAQKGFYHTVEHGETLWDIAEAYRKAGIKVTVEDIRNANSLDKKAAIHAGQKLFIPKK